MKNKRVTKVLFILVVVVIVFTSLGNVYGEINTKYAQGAKHATGEDVLDTAGNNNKLLNPISYLVYFVGMLGEWILSGLAGLVTQERIMPWADRIVFNAVPLLDINFINPSGGTLMAKYLSGIVQNLYFTVLSLAITFFGIAVLVMAIRVLTTAIATDKAKYKEAIMNWTMGLVLLFTIHYLISFIFYTNESMVKIASSIAMTSIETDSGTSENADSVKVTTFAGLAEYFKNQSDEGDVTSRIMYTIFVAQSFLLFFSYIKRLFYVIILAILAPIMVVYDFFKKSIA